jgi:hypothetical protein
MNIVVGFYRAESHHQCTGGIPSATGQPAGTPALCLPTWPQSTGGLIAALHPQVAGVNYPGAATEPKRTKFLNPFRYRTSARCARKRRSRRTVSN